MIIGIAGTLGAGKGTVVEYLKTKGFAHYSSSGKLREILESRGEEVNREAYSKLADEIRTSDPEGLSKMLWQQYETDKPENAIIESLHDIGEAEFVKKNGGIILGINADMEVRYERIKSRGSEKDHVSFDEFKKMAVHEENGGGKHNINAVLKMTDYTIMNNGTVGELQTAVDKWLLNLNK